MREDKSAEVIMSGEDYDDWNPGYYEVFKTAPSLALAICACTFEIMKQMSQKSKAKDLVG